MLKQVKKTVKILFLVPYPLNASPSQRFRFEQYFSLLLANGLTFSVRPFLTSLNWPSFYKNGNGTARFLALITGFVRRIAHCLEAPRYDYVFIHREASPIGPPFFEWFIAKVLRKKIIYDFDDAIWLTDRADESPLLTWLKWRQKVSSICSWGYKVSCGNVFLEEYAARYNPASYLLPTTIDTENLHNPSRFTKIASSQVRVGWTGSHSTLKYLKLLEPVLQRLEIKYPALEFVAIADKHPSLSLQRLRFLPWNLATEIPDLLTFDIGVMPLPDDEWSKGKCGFKILQYMALGIPSVASPVGVNCTIIKDGINGLLAGDETSWERQLEYLINNPGARASMGKAGLDTVAHSYSVASNSRAFLSLFE